MDRDAVRRVRPSIRGGRSVRPRTDPDALKKITALESELLKLRAQIALIVTAPQVSGTHTGALVFVCSQNSFERPLRFLSLGLTESRNAPGTPLMSPVPAPALTSTPRCPAPPPPPPPPPPPCLTSSSAASSVVELIQQRRHNKKDVDDGPLKLQSPGVGGGPEVKGLPSMLDVLKDLNQVKLRSVERWAS